MDKCAFKNLLVWQKSVRLVLEIYKLTAKFPHSELYGLVSQMRRAAVSIPSNIAEGKRKFTGPEFNRHLKISFGSGGELETQIIISKKLGYGSLDDYRVSESLLDEVMRMLNKLISSK